MAENAVKISDLDNGGLPRSNDKFEVERVNEGSRYVEFGELLRQVNPRFLPADINLNNVTESGVYSLKNQTSWATGLGYPLNDSSPDPEVSVPILIVYNIEDSNETMQLFYYDGSLGFSRKRVSSGVWQGWITDFNSISLPSMTTSEATTGNSGSRRSITPSVLKGAIDTHAGNLIGEKLATPPVPGSNDFRVYTLTSGPSGGVWTANTVTATMGNPSGTIGASYGELVRRNVGGTVRTPKPVELNDASNKEYTDNIVREKLADPNELPWNIGDVYTIDDSGIYKKVQIGPTLHDLKYAPIDDTGIEDNIPYVVTAMKMKNEHVDVDTTLQVSSYKMEPDFSNMTSPPERQMVPLYGMDGRLKVNSFGEDNYSAINGRVLNSRIDIPSATTMPTNNRSYVPINSRSGTTFTPSYTLLSEYSTNPSANEIARYGTDGRLKVNKAVDDGDAVNLEQLHTFIPAHNTTNYPGNGTWYIPVVVRTGDTYTTNRSPLGNYGIAPYRGMVVAAGDDGRIRANNAVEDHDVVTKGQADATYATKTSVEFKADKTYVDDTLGNYVKDSDLNTTLSDYVKNSDLNNTLNDYVTSQALGTTLNDYTTTQDLNVQLGTKVNNSRFTISTADPSGGVDGDIWFKVD